MRDHVFSVFIFLFAQRSLCSNFQNLLFFIFLSNKSPSSPSTRKMIDMDTPLSKMLVLAKKRKHVSESKKRKCTFSKKNKLLSLTDRSTKRSRTFYKVCFVLLVVFFACCFCICFCTLFYCSLYRFVSCFYVCFFLFLFVSVSCFFVSFNVLLFLFCYFFLCVACCFFFIIYLIFFSRLFNVVVIIFFQDWEFYIQPSERFMSRVACSVNDKVFFNLKEKFSDRQLQLFRESCFGYFLDLKDVKVQPQVLHCLLLREVCQPKFDEIWFDIYGSRLRFSLGE